MAEQNASDLISLPQGGGALPGIGETFQPDPHTGTGNFSVPLPLLPGRDGSPPQLSLGYSTGNPNSHFGLGWTLTLPQVRRKTSQGIPLYQDGTDVFVLSGTEDLVPVVASDGSSRYRPRTEAGFARITHVRDETNDYWEVWSKDGLRSRYGTPQPTVADAAWSDPATIAGPDGIFAWLISETVDLPGNRIQYSYEPDPGGGPGRQLAEILYADYGDAANPLYAVRVAITYETRLDPFSDCRPGFDLRTTQRATEIAIGTQTATPKLAKTVKLEYADQLGLAPSNGVSLLARVTIVGHDGDKPTEQLPPLEFTYTDWQPTSRNLVALQGDLPRTSLGTPGLDLVDLFGNGRPCILELNGSARYWRNRGDGSFDPPRTLIAAPTGIALGAPGVQLADIDGDGRPDLVVSTPTATGYWPLQAPADRGANGQPAGFDPSGYVAARSAPAISLSDPMTRMLDLNGDGKMDVLRCGQQLMACYNDGHGNFENVQPVRAPDDLGNIDFSDPRVKIADANGDGMNDIVLLHSGSVSYWPNLGYGRFGPRVVMDNPPSFEDGSEYDVTGFDPRRLLLDDVMGTGCADLVYVGDGHVTVWVNQSGNGFGAPQIIGGTPRVSDSTAVRSADIMGLGISGVLWSPDLVRPGMNHAFLDLTGGVKPYLLALIDNHRGATTAIDYSTSTAYAEADAAAKRPWQTTLPFPVQVVQRVTILDEFCQSTLTTEYDYHHGYWDGGDREFRGFARVDQRDAQRFADASDVQYSPPTETRTWYHVGPVGPEYGNWNALDLSDEYWDEDPTLLGEHVISTLPEGLTRRQLRDACRALRGSSLRAELYARDNDPAQDRPYRVTEYQYEVTLITDPVAAEPAPDTGPALTACLLGHSRIADSASATDAAAILPFFPRRIGDRTTEWDRGDDPRTRLKLTDGYDSYGRARRTCEIAVPRTPSGTQEPEPYLATITATSFATRDNELYICDRTVATARYELVNDGSQPLPDLIGSVRSGSAITSRLVGYSHTMYDGQALGTLGAWGLPTGTEQLTVTMGQLARAYSPDGTIANPPQLPPYMLTGDAVPSDGLLGEYFADATFDQLVLTRPELTVGGAWQSCAPDPALSPDTFAAQWTGTLTPPYTQDYTFTAQCIGGVRVWVNDAPVIDAWTQTEGGASTPVALAAGVPVPLKVQFAAGSAGASLQLLWSSASQMQVPLPSDRLAPPPWPVTWTTYAGTEYVDAFRTVVPAGSGYTYHRAGPAHFDGYYESTQRHYDVQDEPAGGRGLLVWQDDALGNRTSVEYDQPYALFPTQVTDATGLVRSATYDYRLLKLNLLTDVNGNQTAVNYSPSGMLTAIAAMGKPDEQVGDIPDYPGTWFIYGLNAYDDNPSNRQPMWVRTVKRVEHAWTLINAEAQALGRPLTAGEIAALFPPDELAKNPANFAQRIDYSDGLGRLLQTRSQADQTIVDLGLGTDPAQPPGPVLVGQQDAEVPRVLVSGWQAYDNKGRVVEKWEPFFDQGWGYEFSSDVQVATSLSRVSTYYDPRGLAVLTAYPDGSQQRVVPGIPADLSDPTQYTPTPWETYTYDQNDEAGRTHPAGSAAWSDHWNTPISRLQDALERVIESTERTSAAALVTRRIYDIDGNLLEVIDPLGRAVSKTAYDLLKRAWRTSLIDAGALRKVLDPRGGTIEQQDAKGALSLIDFDQLHRHRQRWARDRSTDVPTLREVTIYGEAAELADPKSLNLLGRVYTGYDEAGRVSTILYDFRGNLLHKQRQVLSTDVLLSELPRQEGADWLNTAYRADWQPPETTSFDPQAIEAHADTLLDPTIYDTVTTYDALSRPTAISAPTDVTGQRATITLGYGEGSNLSSLKVGPTTYVEDVAYNPRGQRVLCVLGSGTMIRYAYDPATFRLVRLRSESCRSATPADTGWQSSGTILQDHAYGYDLVGNMLSLLDATPGSGVSPQPDQLQRLFTYDPLYRLASGSGREADLPSTQPPWLEMPTRPDTTIVRAYTEMYSYDAANNLVSLRHVGSPTQGSYSRNYQLADSGNQLHQITTQGNNYGYTYDTCGNLVAETTSRLFEWDHANRLATYRNQATPTSEPSMYGQYRYDSEGQRVLKVVRTQGGASSTTVYIDQLFERLELTSAGVTTSYDNLHVVDSFSRVALVRIGPAAPGDTSPPVLYQLGDHLHSSEIVVDADGDFVSREEFLPYGETSYGGYARKRYRFSGKERDEESGLYYYGSRYYAPWLGRWTACDPGGLADGINAYAFVRNNPVRRQDATGRQSQDATDGNKVAAYGSGNAGTSAAASTPDAATGAAASTPDAGTGAAASTPEAGTVSTPSSHAMGPGEEASYYVTQQEQARQVAAQSAKATAEANNRAAAAAEQALKAECEVHACIGADHSQVGDPGIFSPGQQKLFNESMQTAVLSVLPAALPEITIAGVAGDGLGALARGNAVESEFLDAIEVPLEQRQIEFPNITGNVKNRVADALMQPSGIYMDTGYVEIKHVAYQHLSSQIQDGILTAQSLEIPYFLVTAPETQLAGPLQALVNDGTVNWLPVLRPLP